MEWILANLWWIGTPAVMGAAVGVLKIIAKKTSWAYDDKIVTLLEGWLRSLMGKPL